MVDETSYAYLFLSFMFFLVLTIIYLLILYIPTASFENEFNNISGQVNTIIKDTGPVLDQIEDTNKLVQEGVISFCQAYNDPDTVIVLRDYFGSTFEPICDVVPPDDDDYTGPINV